MADSFRARVCALTPQAPRDTRASSFNWLVAGCTCCCPPERRRRHGTPGQAQEARARHRPSGRTRGEGSAHMV
jgi:hypothetical protein